MAKKLFKKIRFFLLLFLGVVLISFITVRIWLWVRFDSVVKDINYPEYVASFNSNHKIPNRVYKAFSKVFNYNENTSTNTLILQTPLRAVGVKINSSDCPCVRVNYEIASSFWDRLSVGLHLDKDVGSKKCLDKFLNSYHFLYGQTGIRAASEYYFDKTLAKLNEKELIKLCIMMKNPGLFNIKDNPENVEKELLKILSE